jgi:predicted DNA-binding protein (UPF0251 family)
MSRRIHHQPLVSFYKPQGVPMGQLRGVTLTLDGLEALRLADAEGLDQESAAELMGVSRPTFSRLLAEARGIVAKGLVNGWAIRIEGGNYEFAGDAPPCGRGRRRCRRGRDGGMTPAMRELSNTADESGASDERETVSGVEPVSAPQAEQAAQSPGRSQAGMTSLFLRKRS